MATSAGSAAVAAAAAAANNAAAASASQQAASSAAANPNASSAAAAAPTASSGTAPSSGSSSLMNSPTSSTSPAPSSSALSPPSPMQPNLSASNGSGGSGSGGNANELQLPAAAAQPASDSPQPLLFPPRNPPGSARSAPRDELMSPTSSSSAGTAPAAAAHRRAMTTATGAQMQQHAGSTEAWMEWPPPASVRGASGSSTNTSFPPGSSVSPSSASPLLHADLPPSQSLYMQGMLTKKGRNLGFGLGFWRTTRLYMLTDTTFSYTDKSKKSVKGEHAVETFKSVTRMTSRRWPNRCFTLVFEDHQLYHLRAPTATECTDWIDSLSKAIQNCEKTKARWRFMRDNQQMQQMAQMAAGGMAPYGSMLTPSPQQQLEMNQMGFSSSPNAGMLGGLPPLQPMPMPMQLPMHPMLAMQMAAMQMPPMHPMAMSYPPMQGYPENMPMETQNNGAAPMLQSRLKSRSRTSLPGTGLGLQRNDSRGSSRSKGLAAAAAGGATGAGVTSSGGGGASSSEQDPHTDDDPEDDEPEAGLSDDQFVSGEDPDREDEGADEYYDDEEEAPTYYRAASQPSYPYAPSAAAAAAQAAAAAYAVAQQQAAQQAASASAWQANQQALLDASHFSPSDQPLLNSQKERLVWMTMFFALFGCVILGMGYEGRTARQIGEVIGAAWNGGTASATAAGAGAIVVASSAVTTSGNATSAAASIADVSSSSSGGVFSSLLSLFAFRWSVLGLLLSAATGFYCFWSLRKLKRAAKKRRLAEAEAKKKGASNAGGVHSPPTTSAQQALVWKEQSKVLAKELALTTRLMAGLGVAAAVFVACAAILYRA